jgi:two-component system CheB/CheR fusion protein
MDTQGSDPESDDLNLSDESESQDKDDPDFIAVGVGASAGGLEAFTNLVSHLPRTTGISFILVQHLDPHHESALPELLAVKTTIPVIRVQNDTPIEPDRIYVIPPNTLMRIRKRTLILEARPATTERFKPIDAFFISLAQEFRSNAVGVVLSGTATDGTLGLKAIKAEGGITFAQNQTAKFDSMPQSAISAGVVDFILPPRRIAEELAAIARLPAPLKGPEGELPGDTTTLHRLLRLLRSNTGIDFTQYKPATILRRLNRRMMVRKSATLEHYFDLLHKEPAEVKALFDDLLINVTDFFRDPEVFDAVKRVALPAVMRDRKRLQTLRIWVPGCSSGEEVYSIAITVLEFLESEDLECPIQLFGTDVSNSAIEKARAGIYAENSVVNVSPERLRRFFVRGSPVTRSAVPFGKCASFRDMMWPAIRLCREWI